MGGKWEEEGRWVGGEVGVGEEGRWAGRRAKLGGSTRRIRMNHGTAPTKRR